MTIERFLNILYASQTGTAREVSENIWRESKCYHFKGTVKALDDYDVRNLIDEKLVIFVCSTTGQGGNKQVYYSAININNIFQMSLIT